MQIVSNIIEITVPKLQFKEIHRKARRYGWTASMYVEHLLVNYIESTGFSEDTKFVDKTVQKENKKRNIRKK